MSEFWKRKVRKYFSTFDFNNDGVISKDDFVGMADTCASFGTPDKQRAEHLKTQFQGVWDQYMKKAENGNMNTLTADELIVSVGKLRYDPELTKPYSSMIRGFHDMLDVNRDGYLQPDEYERKFFQVGIPDSSLTKEAFRAIDVNNDGKISVEEFTNAIFDFFFSDDKK